MKIQQYPNVHDLLNEYLQESNHDYESLSVNGTDPFYLAARSFDSTIARFWFDTLGEEFNRNKEYPHGQTIAYLVVQDDDLQTVRLLFGEMHFDINFIPEHGYTILGNAIENSKPEVFEYLLSLPNVDLQLCDNVSPYYSPLERACKQQDINRISSLLTAMLKRNIVLSPRDLEMMRETIHSKKELNVLLHDYLIKLKKHLNVSDAVLELNHDYKARQLLAHLEFWNLESRLNGGAPQVKDGSKKYSGPDAVAFIMDKLFPLIGFGMLSPNMLMVAYKTIKHLEIMYKLPSSLNIDARLDVEISQALSKFSQELNWQKFQSLKANEINNMVVLIKDLGIFVENMGAHKNAAKIAKSINDFMHSLKTLLEAKLPNVIAPNLESKLAKLASAMQQVNDKIDVHQFVSSLESKKLPKSTQAFLLSDPLTIPNNTMPSNNSHNSFKPKGNKK